MSTLKILLAADEPLERTVQKACLNEMPWEVIMCSSGTTACKLLMNDPVDLAIVDLSLADLNGIELLEIIQHQNLRTRLIILSERGTIPPTVRVTESSTSAFLKKPLKKEMLIDLISQWRPQRTDIWSDQFNCFLETHYANPQLSINHLLQQVKLSKSYAYELFQKHFHETFSRRLRRIRVEKAMLLVKTTDLRMYEIAQQCGFKSQQRLTDAFHTELGISPKKYQNIGNNR